MSGNVSTSRKIQPMHDPPVKKTKTVVSLPAPYPQSLDSPSRRRRQRGSRRGGGSRLLFGDPGLAHALENGLNLSQIRRVVAHRRPIGAGAGDGERRVEREAGLDGGIRLVQSVKL